MWEYEKPDNLVEWWEESVKKFRNNTLFWVRNNKETLDSITYGEIGNRINNARGRLTGALTASAVMNQKIREFFYDIGVPAFDCYGLSETSPAVAMNCLNAYRLGSVGRVLEGQKVVIDKSVIEDGTDDGEIIVYGPNVMKGYLKKPKRS